MKFIKYICCILFISTPSFTQDQATYNMQLYLIKQNYHSNEPIEMFLSIINLSDEELTFKLSDILYQTTSFDLRTSRNEVVEPRPEIAAITESSFANPLLYREILLKKGESFTQTIKLRMLYDIKNVGAYYISAKFYPDPDDRSQFFTSEYVSFTQSAPNVVQKAILQEEIEKTAILDSISKMQPTDVVEGFFNAQMDKDWETFLLFIDEYQLINSFRNFADQYKNTLDGQLKFQIIEQFKKFLTVHWSQPLIKYEIKESQMQKDISYVTVDAIESINTTTRRIRYVITLYRNGIGQWHIIDYNVLILN